MCKSAIENEINPLQLIEKYCTRDQVGLDCNLLNQMAVNLPKDKASMEVIDIISYLEAENI